MDRDLAEAERVFRATRPSRIPCLSLLALLFVAGAAVSEAAREFPACFDFVRGPDSIEIRLANADGAPEPVATCVFRDPAIPRPYLAHLHAPGGVRVSRNHPPLEGVDDDDHATLHPGLWVAFGDLNGTDFWRNRGRVEHAGFLVEPRATGPTLDFSVAERYLRERPDGASDSESGDSKSDDTASDDLVCRGRSSYRFVAGDSLDPPCAGTLILVEVELVCDSGPLRFGPQHEMGFGFRVATPLAVKRGGAILASHGGRNEAGAWGRVGAWWDYSGTLETPLGRRRAGVLMVPSPENARPTWSHARDYGFLAMNPTGPPPGAADVPSLGFEVPEGTPFRMRAAFLLHATAPEGEFDPEGAARAAVEAMRAWGEVEEEGKDYRDHP